MIWLFSLHEIWFFLLRTQIQLFTPGVKSKSDFFFSNYEFSLQEIWFFQLFIPRNQRVKAKSLYIFVVLFDFCSTFVIFLLLWYCWSLWCFWTFVVLFEFCLTLVIFLCSFGVWCCWFLWFFRTFTVFFYFFCGIFWLLWYFGSFLDFCGIFWL